MTSRPDAPQESRLDAIREQAARTGHAAGTGFAPAGGPLPRRSAAGAGYYGLPLLKAPVWTWEVPLYFFLGGVAGASEAIALVARMAGNEPGLERAALWMAALAALVCPALLVADLGRPRRFLHMLRVFKWQSPMSVGAWTLALFSAAAFSALAANEARLAGLAPHPASLLVWAAEIGRAS